MQTKELDLRKEIIETCLRMNQDRINQGTSGNVSARWLNGMLITPSGVPYDQLEPQDIVFLDAQGQHVPEQRPSSEWRFHLAILQHRPEIHAVVHTHSVHATALAMCGMEIPAAHYMVATAGGTTIPCAPYATFGTEALSENALRALEGRKACLLANHGVIALGSDLRKALWLAGEIETLAQQYILSRLLGGPQLLSQGQMAEVIERFKDYGLR